MSTLNHVLSGLLKKYNLTAVELERLTGVPSSTIYRVLKDKSGNPTIEVLKKLSSFFQITVSQLIGEDPIGCRQLPLIQSSNVSSFLNSSTERGFELKTIPIDFPLGGKCFATLAQDNLMEPFILENSILVVDPEREINHKDFVLLLKNENEIPIIRQIIFDGEDFYLKILNSNFPIDLKKIDLKSYYFIGVIVHYRTNLFDIDHFKSVHIDDSIYHLKK